MATTGFHWEGLLRALQGDIMAFIGLFFLLLLIVWSIGRVVNKLIETGNMTGDEAKKIFKWRRGIFIFFVLLAIIVLTLRAVVFISVNRIPRADVDKSSVYEQMNSNLKN